MIPLCTVTHTQTPYANIMPTANEPCIHTMEVHTVAPVRSEYDNETQCHAAPGKLLDYTQANRILVPTVSDNSVDFGVTSDAFTDTEVDYSPIAKDQTPKC